MAHDGSLAGVQLQPSRKPSYHLLVPTFSPTHRSDNLMPLAGALQGPAGQGLCGHKGHVECLLQGGLQGCGCTRSQQGRDVQGHQRLCTGAASRLPRAAPRAGLGVPARVCLPRRLARAGAASGGPQAGQGRGHAASWRRLCWRIHLVRPLPIAFFPTPSFLVCRKAVLGAFARLTNLKPESCSPHTVSHLHLWQLQRTADGSALPRTPGHLHKS